jgi:hypothetical protein
VVGLIGSTLSMDSWRCAGTKKASNLGQPGMVKVQGRSSRTFSSADNRWRLSFMGSAAVPTATGDAQTTLLGLYDAWTVSGRACSQANGCHARFGLYPFAAFWGQAGCAAGAIEAPICRVGLALDASIHSLPMGLRCSLQQGHQSLGLTDSHARSKLKSPRRRGSHLQTLATSRLCLRAHRTDASGVEPFCANPNGFR